MCDKSVERLWCLSGRGAGLWERKSKQYAERRDKTIVSLNEQGIDGAAKRIGAHRVTNNIFAFLLGKVVPEINCILGLDVVFYVVYDPLIPAEDEAVPLSDDSSSEQSSEESGSTSGDPSEDGNRSEAHAGGAAGINPSSCKNRYDGGGVAPHPSKRKRVENGGGGSNGRPSFSMNRYCAQMLPPTSNVQRQVAASSTRETTGHLDIAATPIGSMRDESQKLDRQHGDHIDPHRTHMMPRFSDSTTSGLYTLADAAISIHYSEGGSSAPFNTRVEQDKTPQANIISSLPSLQDSDTQQISGPDMNIGESYRPTGDLGLDFGFDLGPVGNLDMDFDFAGIPVGNLDLELMI
ncbi:hypothetical protein ACJ73_07255 [Blastomyces percursus]|uniref:Uncharacterized protein n=1 Tax=Blastomyces percursus TaxID=1658174 RepID=A0A1J9PZT5_9EURO|nr:hypothetical protein ACJ73_07255 [Blastomyces percursus]